MDRSFGWSVAVLLMVLLVTTALTAAYLRAMFRYRTAVDEAATEVAGVLLRDMFDVVTARTGRAALDLLRPGFVLAAEASGPPGTQEKAVADAVAHVADSLLDCACGGLPAVSVAAYSPATGSLETRGARTPEGWRGLLHGIDPLGGPAAGRLQTAAGQDQTGPWLLYLLATAPERGPPMVVLAEVDLDRMGAEIIAPAFHFVMETHDLTRLSGPGGVALRVTHPEGRVIFAAGPPSDGPTYTLPLFGPDLGSSNVPGTAPLLARITLHPDALGGIISGGLPSSPWPLVIASTLLVLVLTGTGLLLLLRLRRFTLARERFIATVSHELRTPLALLLAYSETVGMERPAPESRRRAATVITRETRRMIHMVENALAFSRGQSSTATLDPRPTDLAGAVADVVVDFQPLADERDARVVLVGGSPVPVRVDGPALRQILNNLLDNAVRHGPEGQEVTVSVESRDGWGVIRVSDEGPGLPPGQGGRLWEPFVQMHGESPSGGTGLGLSIVRHLAELHDGEVSAGNGPDGGAVFTVRIPLDPGGGEASWPAS